MEKIIISGEKMLKHCLYCEPANAFREEIQERLIKEDIEKATSGVCEACGKALDVEDVDDYDIVHEVLVRYGGMTGLKKAFNRDPSE